MARPRHLAPLSYPCVCILFLQGLFLNWHDITSQEITWYVHSTSGPTYDQQIHMKVMFRNEIMFQLLWVFVYQVPCFKSRVTFYVRVQNTCRRSTPLCSRTSYIVRSSHQVHALHERSVERSSLFVFPYFLPPARILNLRTYLVWFSLKFIFSPREISY